MDIKLFEIRDEGTCIPAMAVRVSREDGPIMRRAGYGDPLVVLIMLATMRCQYDPYDWGSARTMGRAHYHIQEHWGELTSGQVIDVRVLLGETTTPAAAECV